MVKITNNLSEIRAQIDKIDKEIIELIKKRISLVTKVGQIKAHTSERIYVPEREIEIFKSLGHNPPLTLETIKPIYTEIISTCRAYEDIFSVGVLDSPNSLLALKNFLGTQVNYTRFFDLNSLFFNYTDYDFILVPITNKDIILHIQNSPLTVINLLTIEEEFFFLLGKTPNNVNNNIFSIFISSFEMDKSIKIQDFYLHFIKGHFQFQDLNLSEIQKENYIFLGTYPKI
ncbi:chorismate mutase [Cetobacterium sp. SF1]|uniref:chorismate mutase n=1 Tax=unclassified Cetobacterium TaxID=2630983 RepID=UPI003CEDF1E4